MIAAAADDPPAAIAATGPPPGGSSRAHVTAAGAGCCGPTTTIRPASRTASTARVSRVRPPTSSWGFPTPPSRLARPPARTIASYTASTVVRPPTRRLPRHVLRRDHRRPGRRRRDRRRVAVPRPADGHRPGRGGAPMVARCLDDATDHDADGGRRPRPRRARPGPRRGGGPPRRPPPPR